MTDIAPEDIYVRLLGLRHEQWRIAQAIPLGRGAYQLLGPIPEGEEWQFQPGQIIECEEVVLTFGDYAMLACRVLPQD